MCLGTCYLLSVIWGATWQWELCYPFEELQLSFTAATPFTPHLLCVGPFLQHLLLSSCSFPFKSLTVLIWEAGRVIRAQGQELRSPERDLVI